MVAAHLGHRRPPNTAAASPAPSATAAAAAAVQISPRSGRGSTRVRRQAVHLGIVEQEEERSGAADPVVIVGQVQLGVPLPGLLEAIQPPLGPLAQVGQIAELDRIGGARVRAGGLHIVLEAVVAERALPGAAVVLAPLDHAERTRRHAVAATVAYVLLDHDRAELGAEQRAGRAYLQAGGVGAVLADVGGHQPSHALARTFLVGLHARRRSPRRAALHPRAMRRPGRPPARAAR